MKKRKSSTLWVALAVASSALLALQTIVFAPMSTVSAFDSELSKIQHRLVSGFAENELNGSAGLQRASAASQANTSPQSTVNYYPRGGGSCGGSVGSNVKVNQNCLNLTDRNLQGRAQAQNEPFIAADPRQPNHIIASYNDYRRGDGTCGVSYSLDKGRTWSDSTVPNNFVRGGNVNLAPREYFQASGDTSVAWDSKGNAYLSCQMFKRGRGATGDPEQSSGMYVFRSTQNFGASFNFPGRPVTETPPRSGCTPGDGGAVGCGQTSFLPLLDKQFMTVDNNSSACAAGTTTATPGSRCTPFQDRVYVTWTEFAQNGTAFIYESYSSDYAESFSPKKLVSVSSSVCVNDYGLTPGGCNENQDSQPFVGPDGVLYVVFNNYNNEATFGTTPDNRNQILLSKSLDGGNTFSAPVKVADFYDLPDCATYQNGHNFGRACVPEKGAATNSYFRANNYPSAAVNPMKPAQVVVTFGSYINSNSNESNGCIPQAVNPDTGQNLFAGVKTPGACNNDIVVSVSSNGGTSFTGTTIDPRALPSATSDSRQAVTDQWWQWIGFTKSGQLVTSYYDRRYGDDETTGFSDISISTSSSSPAYAKWKVHRVTTSSMPLPTQFPDFGGFSVFWGDYAGLAVTDMAYPIWSDTRDPDLFVCAGVTPPAVCGGQNASGYRLNDQDTFTSEVGIDENETGN